MEIDKLSSRRRDCASEIPHSLHNPQRNGAPVKSKTSNSNEAVGHHGRERVSEGKAEKVVSQLQQVPCSKKLF
jgi:hypothetical protein